MLTITPKTVAGSMIRVTSNATNLYDLMDTAGNTTNSTDYYRGLDANAILIQPEDGDIRFLFGANPEIDAGTLVEKGDRFLMSGVILDQMNIVRAGLQDPVTCSVQLFTSEPAEASAFSAGKVSLDESTLNIGSVDLAEATLTSLTRITKELKKITFHLSLMTEVDLQNKDIDPT